MKITLPGPYLLMRAMFVPEVTGAFYAAKEALGDDWETAAAKVAAMAAATRELRGQL